MAGRKKGSKNKIGNVKVYIGDPYVNLTLAVLKQARLDEGTEYEDSLWSEFIETKAYKQGSDRLDVLNLACAMGSYLEVK